MQAVSTLGSGSLSRVRVIHLAATNLYWFEVDSVGGRPSIKEGSGNANNQSSALPAWVLSAKPLFPAQTTGKRSDMESYCEDGPEETSVHQLAEDRLTKRAKHWQQRF